MTSLDQIITYLRVVVKHADADQNTRLCDVLREGFSEIPHDPAPGDVMHLIIWIEQTFGFEVEIDDINPDHFHSPTTLAAYIDRSKQS